MELELDPSTYAGYQAALHPTHLAGPWGIAWGNALGRVKDGVRLGAIYAVKSHFITVCPEDGLGIIGYERGLERGPSESVGGYRLRLQYAWDSYTYLGTDKGIVDSLLLLGYHAHVIRDRGTAWTDTGTVVGGVPVPGVSGTWTKVTLPGWVHDLSTPIWGRMWVVIDKISTIPWNFLQDYTAVAAAYPTYANYASTGRGYGLSATLAEIATITRLVKKWTGSHALVVNIIVIARGMLYGFPAIESYAALPGEFLASYIVYWDGM